MFGKTIVMGSMAAALPSCVSISLVLGLLTPHVHAQTLTTLYSFSGSDGYFPEAGLTLSGSMLYGTTYYGGAGYNGHPQSGNGTVFSLPAGGGSLTVLASFNGPNGSNPQAGLTVSGNKLYGTTVYTASGNGGGTVFSVPLGGGNPTVLGAFNGSNGIFPVAGLTLSGNTLYGTASEGGAFGSSSGGYGTVFSLPLSGGTPAAIVSFSGTNGTWPFAGLTLSGSTLYGTTNIGGANSDGTVFSVPLSGGAPTVLTSFSGSNGSLPRAVLTLIGNTMYGTAEEGGAYGDGVVFSVPVSGGTPTVLASFNGSDGKYPESDLTLIGDTFYGTTLQGGTYSQFGGGGTIFSLPVSGGTPTVLASFNNSNGFSPVAGLTLSGNTLYGTTEFGGAYGDGTVFALALPTPEPGTLALVGAMLAAAFVWRRCRHRLALIAAITLLSTSVARADVFNMPTGQTSLQFVTVGDPGNRADTVVMYDYTTGYGSVNYRFEMGKYDVTLGQYCQFLNAVAASDSYGCYNSNMLGGGGSFPFCITQSGSPGSYTYSVSGSNPQAANMPVYCETWGDAARFCNWLQNGQPTGAEGNGTTETGAYQLSGGTTWAALMAVASPAHSGSGAAHYFLPSENEWYKAAYYKSGGTNAGYWTYPTKSNTAPDNSLALAHSETNDANYIINSTYTDPTNLLTPVGTFSDSPGPYGTDDMGGDLNQWNEANNFGNGYRGLRGGSFIDVGATVLASSGRGYGYPLAEAADIGFRVASSVAVPEPGSIALILVGAIGLLGIGRRRLRSRIMQGLLAAVMMASAFSAKASTIPMPTVQVGNAGNAADTNTGSNFGAVGYTYNIGTDDVTLTQYTAFLNSVAATDTYGLYNTKLGTDLNVAGISRSGLSGSYSYAVIGDGQRPVTYVSWYDAVRFVNWLGTGNTESGAYTITSGGSNSGTVTVPTTAQRDAWAAASSGIYWYLPDENEWYKAAYYDPTIAGSNKYWTYPTKSNSAPSGDAPPGGTNSANINGNNGFALTQSTSFSSSQNYLTDVGAYSGSPGPYGTFDQGGDVFQWNDLNPDVTSSPLGVRGGCWANSSIALVSASRPSYNPTHENTDVGFRVASVPEPGSITLALAGGVLSLALARRRCAATRSR